MASNCKMADAINYFFVSRLLPDNENYNRNSRLGSTSEDNGISHFAPPLWMQLDNIGVNFKLMSQKRVIF